MSHVLLVCGSLAWTDAAAVADVIRRERHRHRDLTVRHGAASRGADDMAARICDAARIPQDPMPATWRDENTDRYRRWAGMERNAAMLAKDPKPYLVAAFQLNGSKGTQSTIDEAKKRGVALDVLRKWTISGEWRPPSWQEISARGAPVMWYIEYLGQQLGPFQRVELGVTGGAKNPRLDVTLEVDELAFATLAGTPNPWRLVPLGA